jgi:hypothetical protein
MNHKAIDLLLVFVETVETQFVNRPQANNDGNHNTEAQTTDIEQSDYFLFVEISDKLFHLNYFYLLFNL